MNAEQLQLLAERTVLACRQEQLRQQEKLIENLRAQLDELSGKAAMKRQKEVILEIHRHAHCQAGYCE